MRFEEGTVVLSELLRTIEQLNTVSGRKCELQLGAVTAVHVLQSFQPQEL